MEQVDEEHVNFVNSEPEKLLPSFNPFETGLWFLSQYGWYALGLSGVLLILWGWISPRLPLWQDKLEDVLHKKNDDDVKSKQSDAMEMARARQQRELALAAIEYQKVLDERAAKKKEDYIKRNEGKGAGGNRLGARSEYSPLCGAGSSGGYKAPKKKCPGGGCGK